MTYGDDRTAGAMGEDERREYVRRSAMSDPTMPAALRERIAEMMPWGCAGSLARADAVLAEIAKTHDLVERCQHESGYSGWSCDECFEENYQQWQETERQNRMREGKVRHFRLVPCTSDEAALAQEGTS